MAESGNSDTACLRCTGKMTEGYLLDVVGLGGPLQSRWVSGSPRAGMFGSPKPGDAAQYKVSALRCDDSGWLDLFARKQAY